VQIVLDTNIYISFLLSKKQSPVLKILHHWQKGKFVVLLSKPILKELTRVLTSKKIFKLINLKKEEIKQYLQFIVTHSLMIEPHSDFKKISKDPTDNKFLNLAKDGRAEYIVTGDKHLLDLKTFQGVKILTPTQFTKLLD